MKKIWKALLLVSVLCIGSVFAYSAWTLLTTTQEINVVEGVEMQYWDGAAWVNVPLNTGTVQILPASTLKPGESQVTYIQVSDTANPVSRPLNLNMGFSFEDYVATTVECHPTMMDGQTYTYVGNSLDMLLMPDSTWRTIGIKQTMDGASSLETQTIEGSAARSNALDRYMDRCEVPV